MKNIEDNSIILKRWKNKLPEGGITVEFDSDGHEEESGGREHSLAESEG